MTDDADLADLAGLHADLDALADALAAESDGQPLPTHLQTCPACATALADLRRALVAVATDLAALPAVPAVPAALEQVGAAPRPTTVLPSAEVTSLDARRRGRRWLLAAGGVAAAAALVIGGGLLLSSSPESDRTSQSAAARGEFPVSATGTDYRTPAALQVALPRLLAGQQESVDTLAQPQKSAAGPRAGSASADPLARLRTPDALAACLASLTDPADEGVPLALDYASYQGKPALVVVLPSSRPSKVDIWVVGAACNQLESDLLVYVKADRPGR